MKEFVVVLLAVVFFYSCADENINPYLIIDDETEVYNGQPFSNPEELPFKFQIVSTVFIDSVKEISPVGRISNIEIDDFGNLFVLDSQKLEIYVFNKEGEFNLKFGRAGKGPGEFFQPNGMTLFKDSLLFVSDALSKIEAFEIKRTNNGRVESILHSNTIAINYSPRTICTIDEFLFVQSIHFDEKSENQLRIKRMDLSENGLENLSFGAAYPNIDRRVSSSFSQGRISCNESLKKVNFLYDRIPLLETFDIDGKIDSKLAFTEMKSFETELFMVDGSQGIRHLPPADGIVDFSSSFYSLNNQLFFHYLRIKYPEGENLGFNTFVVDQTSNKVIHHSNSETILASTSINNRFSVIAIDEGFHIVKNQIN